MNNKAGSESALLSLRYPIFLRGNNIFEANAGGAITLLQAQMDISGELLFKDNTASSGAAIHMLDYSTVSACCVRSG